MGCNCGKAKDPALTSTTLRMAEVTPLTNGIYQTTAFPDCQENYSGAFPGAFVYIVDVNGPNEKFFLRSQWKDAALYARRNGWTLNQLPARDFCHDLMLEVLGG
jgi:hypothetical protein